MGSLIAEHLEKVLIIALVFPVAALLVLMIHELAHYVAARILGARIDHVSVGYGREVRRWEDRHKTVWSLRAFPLGGHVQLAGRDDMGGEGTCFADKPLWQRMAIVLVAPAVNFVLPFFLLFPFLLLVGLPSMPPVLVGVEPGEVADRAGLQPGDKFVEIEGVPVRRYEQVAEFTRPVEERELDIVMERDGERFRISVTPSYLAYVSSRGQEKEIRRLGIVARHQPFRLRAVERVGGVDVENNPDLARTLIREQLGRPLMLGFRSEDRQVHDFLVIPGVEANEGLFDPDHKYYDSFFAGSLTDNFYLELTPAEAFWEAWKETRRMLAGILGVPFQLFPIDDENVGPETVVSTETSLLKSAIFRFLYMAAMVSVVMGMVNLVPFPGLDGHQVLLGLSEAVVGAKRTELIKARLTVVALGAFYLFVLTWNVPDIATYLHVKIEQTGELLDDFSNDFSRE
ncbi:MAG: RIP metalloprotease [Alphaproteobacteria bacterium]|nr:RIP metalloprotease [Alphaproteobacteria bacterium]